MSFFAVLMLATGLAMDAMAASAAQGLASPTFRLRQALLCALFFGGFQALMPLLGAGLGQLVGPWLQQYNHWIAFVLLSGLGAKMLYESRNRQGAPVAEAGIELLLLLAVATSIDAFIVGITLPMLNASLPLTITTIGVVTAILSFLGVWAGRRVGSALGGELDAFGGFVLIALGAKILLQRLL